MHSHSAIMTHDVPEVTEAPLARDKRTIFAQTFNALALVSALLGIIMSDQSYEDQLMLLVLITIFALIIGGGQFLLRHNNAASLMFAVLSVYVWIAYPLKVILMIHDPMASWVSHQLFDVNSVRREIVGAFYTVIPGIFALFLGFLAGGKNFSRHREVPMRLRHGWFIAIVIGLMLLKIFVQLVLDIGLPGVRPRMTSVPFLVGLLDMLTRPVLFATVNLYFYCVLRLNERRGLLIGLSLMLLNLLLAVRVGWKGELVIQGLLIAFYLVDVYEHMERGRRRVVAIVAVGVMVATVNLYTLVSEYRNYILSGRTMSEAIDKAEDREKTSTSSVSLYSIYNRINGIDAYYAAVKLGRGKEFALESLLNDNVMDLILVKLYGYDKDKAVTAFGTTQFSVLYLVGGIPLLITGCFVLGWVFRWITGYLKNRLFTSHMTFYAYLPLLCILWIKMLSAGGMLSLYIKELMLIIGCLYCIERVCYLTQTLDADEDCETARAGLSHTEGRLIVG